MVVLVVCGGREHSDSATRWWPLADQRMVPIAHAVQRAARDVGGAVWLVRNRVLGWNEPRQDPVRDGR